MISNNALSNSDSLLAQSLERLSSGYKINHAKDNPAGLAMSKRMNAQIQGLKIANQNASDGVSVIETADGAMNEISEILQRMNELSIQAANGTMSESDRKTVQEEISKLKEEITRIADVTEFNGQKILNGEFSLKGYTNQVDVKVNAYSEDVAAKLYNINSITILQNEDGSYDVDLDTLDLGSDFPEGARVDVKDDLVVIHDDNGFEMQLDVSRINFDDMTADADGVKSVTYPKEVVSGLTVTETATGTGHEIKSVTITKNADGSYALGAIDLSDFPDGVTASITGDTLTITNDDGSFTAELDLSTVDFSSAATNADGAQVVSFPTFSALTIDATGIGAMRLQVGANEGQVLAVDIPAITLKNMEIENIDVSTQDGALDAIERLNAAVKYVSSVRGRLGAYENRLESTINNLDVSAENMTAAYSRIMDVDMAEEMTNYTTYQVLTQAGTSMLAQANERPAQVLQLLQ